MIFSIHLNVRDLELLKIFKNFFGVGNIQKNADGSITYSVTGINDLIGVIIPHFDKYPLLTNKQADFELFKLIGKLMYNKEHLTVEGLHKILSIRAAMNNGLSKTLKIAFPNVISISRPKVKQIEINFNWLAGFVDGEGSFIVSIYKSKTTTGYAVKLIFSLSQNYREIELLNNCVKFLKCGKVYERPLNSAVELIITKFSDLENNILPLFNKYPLFGIKQHDYEDFCKIASLMRHKEHLTDKGINEIRQISLGMNRRRII